MATTDKLMTIKQACRLLGISSRKGHLAQLADRLGTSRQTVEYWNRRKAGELPHWWVDRVQRMRESAA